MANHIKSSERDEEESGEAKGAPSPSGETASLSKSERTRERILASALELFTEKGFAQTTMRDIAERSGSSLGLAYRYFARKEELVIALYDRLASEFAEEVASLPREPIAARFAQAVRLDIARLAPYRDAFGALFSVGLDLDSDVAVLGEAVAPIRARVWDIFRDVVAGASDAPRRQREIDDMATVFYATHLAYVLFWLQDRTPNQTATTALLAWVEETLTRLRPFLRLPLAARSLARLAAILTPMFREKF